MLEEILKENPFPHVIPTSQFPLDLIQRLHFSLEQAAALGEEKRNEVAE